MYDPYRSLKLLAQGNIPTVSTITICIALITHENFSLRFTPALYKNLGYPQASSLLGALAFAFSILPFLLMAYGPQIRRKSRVAKQIAWQQDKRMIEAENNRGDGKDVETSP